MNWAYGTTRTVLLIGKYALKFPTLVECRLNLLGRLANMQECRFSEMEHDRLCPVLWSLPRGWLVVMPICKTLTREELSDWQANSEYQNMPIEVESKPCSWGWHKGRVVAVDYGN